MKILRQFVIILLISFLGELLKAVQLEGFEKRKIREMSGGQRQRVALARALAQIRNSSS